MKRAALLTALLLAAPSAALAQIPLAPATNADAPKPSTPPPPAPPSPAANEAPTQPASAPPGDQYYVEPAPTERGGEPPAAAPSAEPALEPESPVFEPPPPPPAWVEPPAPPEAFHLTPRRSLWLGARLGWFFPFGNLWARAATASSGSDYVLKGVPWRDYAASGPTFELDAGVRLARAYTLFGLWERAQLRSGRNDQSPDGAQNGAETDFWAIGLRASSNPDGLGFLTEVAVGYRRARTFFKNDVEYQFTDAPFEARLGLGAELRLSRLASVSALATIGVGSFGTLERVAPNGNAVPLAGHADVSDGHSWATLTLAAHFDLLAARH